jgi:hypothetical protein
VGFLRSLFRITTRDYELKALVSARMLEPLDKFSDGIHVFCDLDKTYLETEFESWIKMAKIPFESPHDKITVPGASEVLECLRWGGDPKLSQSPKSGLHFVSSSPPQLRLALDGKLTLDHLEWTSDTFKNQSYNLRMARIDLLRHHIAYKTKAILDIATRLPDGSRIIMIGDNAEYDAFIYTGVRLFLEGRFNLAGLKDWLRGAQVEESVIGQVVSSQTMVPKNLKIVGIFIRSLPGYGQDKAGRFESGIYRFDQWIQIAWNLILNSMIHVNALPKLVRSFHNFHGVPLPHLRWCLSQVLDQKQVGSEMRTVISETLSRMGATGENVTEKKLLAWDLNMAGGSQLDLPEVFLPRMEASQWYQSIEKARQDRKRRRGASSP